MPNPAAEPAALRVIWGFAQVMGPGVAAKAAGCMVSMDTDTDSVSVQALAGSVMRSVYNPGASTMIDGLLPPAVMLPPLLAIQVYNALTGVVLRASSV